MGNLTDDMTRLRGEIDALRGARSVLMQDLTRGARDLAAAVSAMKTDLTAAHNAMAKKTKRERETFVGNMVHEVNSLLGDFSRFRGDMARAGKRDRGNFLMEMRRQVTGMLKETADDLTGARFAWGGKYLRNPPIMKRKREPEIMEPAPPPVKEEAVTEKKQEAPPEMQLQAMPEITEPEKVDTPKVKAVAPPKAKTPAPVVDSMTARKRTKRSRPDEKPAKAATKAKRGRK
ncbi:MAG: hypothetical protein A2X96_08890 [Syntrophobacterales bacterium GWC2_56_13]|nr:MAG: hypothetical protein A2X96_08890 [Syntrophobacterales bacterium GWC2_56_13]